MGALFLFPLAALLYGFDREIVGDIAFANSELSGVAVARVASNRLHSALTGVGAKETAVEMDAANARFGADLRLSSEWKRLKDESGALSSPQNRDAFEKDFPAFMATLGANSNLILDPTEEAISSRKPSPRRRPTP